MAPISRHSPMLYATTNRIAANAASGMNRARGAAASRMTTSVRACTIPAIGDRAPERMLVAVRAIAPVAGNAAEKRHDQIRRALRDQFHVGLVAITAHVVGDDGGEQALDRRQQRDGDGRRQERHDQIGANLREAEAGQARRDPAEPAADRLNVEPERHAADGRDEQGDDRSRHAPRDSGPNENDGERGQCDAERLDIDRAEVSQQFAHPLEEFARHVIDRQAEKVLDLRGGDQDRDAVREADRHGPGNVANRRAQAGQAHGEQHHTGHERAGQKPRHAELGHDAGDDHDECAGRPGDLAARAAERGDDESGDDGGVDSGHGRDAGRDGERHGQRQGDQADGHSGYRIGYEIGS